MKKILLILIVVIITSAVISLSKRGSVKDTHLYKTTGTIAATEADIIPVLSLIIADMPYKEGDRVTAGDMLVQLDNGEISAELKELEAEILVAKSRQKEAESYLLSKDAEIAMIEAEAGYEAALLKDSRRNLDRIERLLADGVVTQSDYDHALIDYETKGSKIKIVEAKKGMVISQKFTASAQIESAKGIIKQKEAGMSLLKTRMEDTVIKSPLSGIISKRYFEEGERAKSGVPILTIIDDSYMWVRVDIEEHLIDRLRIGYKAKIIPSFMPHYTFDGKIIEIGEEGDFATQRDVKRGIQDIKTFKVKVEISSDEKKVLKPGMTAEVIFD